MAEKGLPPNDNRGPVVLAISWATVTLAAVIVSLRLYTRLALGAQAGIDDAAIVLATVGDTRSVYTSSGAVYMSSNFTSYSQSSAQLGTHTKFKMALGGTSNILTKIKSLRFQSGQQQLNYRTS